MENESIVIKKALAIVNENNTELKNVFANKSSKLAASLTPPSPPPPSPPPSSPSSSPQFYIVEITADQVNESDTGYETEQFRTTATDYDDKSWKILFEMYGWSNVRTQILRQESVQSDLFKYVSNDAITESTLPKARFARAASYYVEIPFKDASGKDDKKVFVTQPSFMNERTFQSFLNDTIKDIDAELLSTGSSIKVGAPTFKVAKGPGSFQFDQIRSLFSSSFGFSGGFSGSGTGLAQEFAWQIDCRDSVGNQHVFRTVKSDKPVEMYEQKLRNVGFTDIRARAISKPGTLTLDDIELGKIQSNLSQSLRRPDGFENLERNIGDIQDKFENSGVGKAIKTIKKIHDWWKK
jgi:hypothetical protein